MDNVTKMVLKNPPKVPKNFDKQIINRLNRFYIFKDAQKKTMYCNHCKKEMPIDKFYYYGEQKHNQKGYCPCCHYPITFKDSGRGRKRMEGRAYAIIALPMRNGAVLIRTFMILVDYQLHRDGRVTFSEFYRIYLKDGKERIYRRNWSYTEPYWGEYPDCFYCNISQVDLPHDFREQKGLYCGEPIYLHFGIYNSYAPQPINLYFGFDDQNYKLQKTCLKYCDFAQWSKNLVTSAFVTIARMFNKYPVVEQFQKVGFKYLLDVFLRYLKLGKSYNRYYYQSKYEPGIINWRKKNIKEALKVSSAQYKQLLKSAEDTTYRDVVCSQLISKYNIPQNLQDELKAFTHPMMIPKLKTALKYITFYKIVKYSDATSRIEYLDYISQCEELNLNMRDKSILFPKNLNEAHAETTSLLTYRKNQKKIEEIKNKYKSFFKKTLPELQKKYTFSADGYTIKPFATVEELLNEGLTLSHCIYTNYSNTYFSGKTILLALRKNAEPDVPFYSVELSLYNTVLQCRGSKNKAPNTEVKHFMKKFESYINENKQLKRKAG